MIYVRIIGVNQAAALAAKDAILGPRRTKTRPPQVRVNPQTAHGEQQYDDVEQNKRVGSHGGLERTAAPLVEGTVRHSKINQPRVSSAAGLASQFWGACGAN